MKRMTLRFTPESARLVSNLHPHNKRIIKAALKELKKDPYLGDDLQEELIGFKSYKPKRFRIIYKVNEEENCLDIFYLGHRRDVYEQFRTLLQKLT